MDARERAIAAVYALIGMVIGLVAGYLLILYRPRRKYLAHAEYWVFLPGEKLPDQNEIMTRTVGLNPYQHKRRTPIGTNEGLLFSDVRLHIALVLRQRNPHSFRPDLFDTTIEVPPNALDALAQANSFVKVRYVSEDPLSDARHLQFLPHVADAIAELGDGVLIYDTVAERLIVRADLQDTLREQSDVSGPDLHTRVVWRPETQGGRAETRGLAKMGHPELRTPATEPDQKVIVSTVLEEAIRRIWLEKALPESLDVEAFDDRFRVLFQPSKDRFAQVRILRVRNV